MKRLRIDAIIFILLLTALGAANILNKNKPTISELENRVLKSKPVFSIQGIFNGSYLHDFEEYYNDTFVLRDFLVKENRNINDLLTFTKPDIALVMAVQSNDSITSSAGSQNSTPEVQTKTDNSDSVASMGGNTDSGNIDTAAKETASASTSPSQTASTAPASSNNNFDENKNIGYWVVKDGKAVQLFKFKKESMEYYSYVLNKYHEALGSGVKLFSLIPPSASEFLKLKNYKGISDSQNYAISYLNSKLDPDIKTVDAYSALDKHKNEYVYFRTDHHWTALGAYYAYSAFMDANGEVPVPLNQYKTDKVEGFLGSAYTQTLNKSLEKNPDTINLYLPFTENTYTMHDGSMTKKADVIDMKYAKSKDKYLIFLSSGGATWSVINTNVKNGKKILLLKDSFGNALAPFLIPHYEEVYVVDTRFYNSKLVGKNIVQFVQDNGIGEVVLETYMENVNWKKFMNGVENLMGE